MDGLEKTHNKIRGNPSAFANTIKNLKKIISVGIPTNSACVIQKENFAEIEKLADFVCSLGVDSLTFLVANNITKEEKSSAIKQINKITSCNSNFYVSTIKNRLGEISKKEILQINKKVNNVKRIVTKYGKKVSFSEQLLYPKLMFKETSLSNFTCSLFNGYSPYVYEDGNLNTCAFTKLQGEKFDLSKNTPLKILNSEEYIKIRKKFKKFGAMEKCRYCCALRRK